MEIKKAIKNQSKLYLCILKSVMKAIFLLNRKRIELNNKEIKQSFSKMKEPLP